MSEKVTLETLKKYATVFCSLVLNKAYTDRSVLSGQDLLKLTPVKQINQNILSRLSVYWNSQIQHFQTPYFDFSAPEVQEALRQFSGVVSRHISLRREHLEPWLEEAVEKALAPLATDAAFSPENEALVQQFSEVLPLTLPERTVPQPPPASSAFSFFDLVAETQETTPPAPATPAQPERREEKTTVQAAASATPESINSRHKVEIPQASDEVRYGNVRIKLENIGQNIPLGQRFMFIGQLFKGDFDAFSQAIETLDASESFDAAYRFITGTLVPRYEWKLDDEAVAELVSLVKRRFS